MDGDLLKRWWKNKIFKIRTLQMIKKVYIIWWWAYNENFDQNLWKTESDFLTWKIKNQSYELMITKWFIDKYWKDNVINCRVRWTWEYKNIFRYKWYHRKQLKLFKELRKNRKESLFMFHWIYPQVLIYALIPSIHKCRRRHAIIWQYNKCESKLKWIILRFIQKIFWHLIDTIFYVNENEKKELINYKYKWNIFFLPIPINTKFWEQKHKQSNKSVIHIASTWSICHRKNQRIIVDAVNIINKNNPDLNFEINLIGRAIDLKYKSLLQNDSNNIIVNLRWSKTADELKEIYKTTDIYIQASFSEWLCQTYIEACLSWCPLILSDIPTFTDTAKDCALFFNPFDAEVLANKILYMIEQINEYRKKSKKLAKEFKEFGYKSFHKQLNLFLSEIIK